MYDSSGTTNLVDIIIVIKTHNSKFCIFKVSESVHRGHCVDVNSYSAGIDFRRQNLTYVDVRF